MASDYITQWDLNGDVYDIHDADRGLPNGVATLGEDGLVSESQLPSDLVRSVNNIPPEDGNVGIDSIPIRTHTQRTIGWSTVAMFNSIYGISWRSGYQTLAECYYKDYTYRLFRSSSRFYIYKYTSSGTGEEFAEVESGAIEGTNAIVPLMFGCNAQIHLLYSDVNHTSHYLIFSVTDGSIVLNLSVSDLDFTYIRYYPNPGAGDDKGVLLYTVQSYSEATKTGYVGVPLTSTAQSIALEYTYSGGIHTSAVSSGSLGRNVYASIGSAKTLYTFSQSSSGLNAYNLDSSATYSVETIGCLDSSHIVIADNTSGHLLILSSATSPSSIRVSKDLGSSSAKIILPIDDSDFLTFNTVSDSKFYLNLRGSSVYNVIAIDLQLPSEATEAYYSVVKGLTSSGKILVLLNSSNSGENHSYLLSSMDGKTFTPILGLTGGEIGVNVNYDSVRLMSTAFDLCLIYKDSLNFESYISDLDSCEGFIPSLAYGYN